MAYKGRFVPKNPAKYKGQLVDTNTGQSAIIWRSTWELKVFNWCDTHPNVLEWSSEEISIPYISPIDDRMHRYYPDIYLKLKQADGKIVKKLIEIKPQYQTSAPKLQKKLTPKYIAEVKTWGVNEAKWNAAKRFCEEHNIAFEILTERDLFGTPTKT